MAAIATGYFTANSAGIPLPSVPHGYATAFPGTFAAWGTFGSGTIKLQAGFIDAAGALNWLDVTGASLTAAGSVNFSTRCDRMQIVLSGATTPNIGYWIG